jgi:polyhydroxyalkanoate synthase
MAWLKPMAGELVKAPAVETKQYPSLADAPGTYVHEA